TTATTGIVAIVGISGTTGTVETQDMEETTGISGHDGAKHQSGESGTCQMSENLSDIRERRRRFLQLLRTIPQWRPCGRQSIGRLHHVACSQVHCMQLSFSLRLLACGQNCHCLSLGPCFPWICSQL